MNQRDELFEYEPLRDVLLGDWLINRGVSSECVALCLLFLGFCVALASRLATTI